MNQSVQTIAEALRLLKEGQILISDSRVILFQKGELLYAKGISWQAALSVNDFQRLFDQNTFWVYEKKEEKISSEKDEDYYQWASRYL